MSNPAFKFDHVHIISRDPHASAVGGSLLCYVAAPDGVSIELMQC